MSNNSISVTAICKSNLDAQNLYFDLTGAQTCFGAKVYVYIEGDRKQALATLKQLG